MSEDHKTRINAVLVAGGVWHDIDFARLEILKLLAEDDRVRVRVFENYEHALSALSEADIVVFLDGDYSDFPEEMPALYEPIVAGVADLVVGSRVLGEREKGALLPQARFGNWLSTRLIRWLFGVSFTDLGPFRAIDHKALKRLDMCDRDFGWTVEMQVKAARLEMRCTEVPVRYRKRIGISKISGTLSGSVRAGHKILWTIFKYRNYSG